MRNYSLLPGILNSKCISLGSADYKINIKDNPELRDNGWVACINYDEEKISIQSNLNAKETDVSLLHELMHGILNNIGLDDQIGNNYREIIAEGFAQGIYEILKRNNLKIELE